VHHGTRRAPARIVQLDDGVLAQLRLESALMARAGDRFVLRRIAPQETVGGGRVLDATPRRHGPGEVAQRLVRLAAIPSEELAIGAGQETYSRPVREPAVVPASTPEPDERALRALELIKSDAVAPRSPAALAEELGCTSREAEASLQLLVESRRAVRVKPGVFYDADVLERLRFHLLAFAAERDGGITLAEARDELTTSRKYAQALLEHLDAEHLTVRKGDRHILRRAAREKVGRSIEAPVGRQGSGGPAGLQSQEGGVARRLEGSIPSPPRRRDDRMS
jgi:selenocysteine-specific elongation factor